VSDPANQPSLPRVVVAEDHPVSRLVLEDQLKGIGGCEVTACASGAEALRALERAPAALLLTDINLPDIDGLALARMIRAGKAGQADPQLPIVVITATAGPEERLACDEARIDTVLIKPVSFETLGAVVRRYLGVTG
jgi:two-component system capsular synthesis sensor histidine kinase RcsC